MSDMQENVPGGPGTPEGEAGDSESNPVAPSVEGREEAQGEGTGEND